MNEKEELIIAESEFDHVYDEIYHEVDNLPELDISYTVLDKMSDEWEGGVSISHEEVEKATLEFLKRGGRIRRI
jgi:hypothetical protein